MITDEGQQRAANTMHEAAEMHLRAANTFSESVRTLEVLLGEGYGNNISRLVEELQKLNYVPTPNLPTS